MKNYDLEKLRLQIDKIDEKILDLINERTECALKIGDIKKREGKKFHVPSRERAVIENLTARNKGPFPDKALKVVYREIMSACLSLEHPLKVAFLGPRATFTHMACLENFGSSAEMISKNSIGDVFDDVERERVDYGVVPVENSNEGMVSHTLDKFVDSSVNICGEFFLEVSHCLLSKSGKLEDIRKICSHSQPIAQCRDWLSSYVPEINVMFVDSTAQAAQMAMKDPGIAAIASEYAADIYNLKIIEKKIEDNPNNFTRFLVIGNRIPDRTGNDKTSILFSVKDEVSILYKMLEPFSTYGINLTKIESRPLKKKAWEYIFYIDMEGHIDDEMVKKAIESLKAKSLSLKVLGSYPCIKAGS